jgi:hypothetical protein
LGGELLFFWSAVALGGNDGKKTEEGMKADGQPAVGEAELIRKTDSEKLLVLFW